MNTATEERTIELLDLEPVTHNAPALNGSRAVAAAPQAGPLSGALALLQQGASIADMKELLAMQREYEANEARKAFAVDMAEFKKHPPTILKDKHVEFTTQRGVTAYDHATIGNVCNSIIQAAAAYGFTHRWIPSTNEKGQMVVTCEVTHRLGHKEETRLEGSRDDSGGKNAIQGVVSTNTYLSRHSLLMAFGFATMDQPDDDGRGAGNGAAAPPAPEPTAYPDDQFKKNTAAWKKVIEEKRKTPAALLAMVEAKHPEHRFTEAQVKTLNSWQGASL